MKRPAPRVMVCWVESADERCAVCGELLNPNFGKKLKYWMQYPIVEPMLVDGVKLCDKTIKPVCLYTYLDHHRVIPVGRTAVLAAQMDLF